MINLIPEAKVGNASPVSQFCVPDTQYHSDLTAQEREEVYDLVEC